MAWDPQVVPAQRDRGDHTQNGEQDQLAPDEAGQYCLSALSTSGPPGTSFGFGVYRTSGIIVSGLRPHDCSSARSAPENPVPVRTALSMELRVRSSVSDRLK